MSLLVNGKKISTRSSCGMTCILATIQRSKGDYSQLWHLSQLLHIKKYEPKSFLENTCACRSKKINMTHGLSLPPVTIKPSLNVVYIVKTGPLWALATIRIKTWSFQTQTSPLIVPVNVKLFWKEEKYTNQLILSKAREKHSETKIITICF